MIKVIAYIVVFRGIAYPNEPACCSNIARAKLYLNPRLGAKKLIDLALAAKVVLKS